MLLPSSSMSKNVRHLGNLVIIQYVWCIMSITLGCKEEQDMVAVSKKQS